MDTWLCCAAAICTVILARVDWPAEARKAQEALAAAALTGGGGVSAADEEAPGGSAGGSQAEHRPGERSPHCRPSQAPWCTCQERGVLCRVLQARHACLNLSLHGKSCDAAKRASAS